MVDEAGQACLKKGLTQFEFLAVRVRLAELKQEIVEGVLVQECDASLLMKVLHNHFCCCYDAHERKQGGDQLHRGSVQEMAGGSGGMGRQGGRQRSRGAGAFARASSREAEAVRQTARQGGREAGRQTARQGGSEPGLQRARKDKG